MEGKRKFNRLYAKEKKAIVSWGGTKNEVGLLDVSAGGMRFFSTQPLELGELVYGEFKILSNLDSFFIKGRVIRSTKKEDADLWEIAVKFEKISTIPLIS